MPLHCFDCGNEIYKKGEDYDRVSYLTKYGKKRSKPVCSECLANAANAEHDQFLEEEWYRNNPGMDPEEEHRKKVYLAKYGEY